MTTASAPPAVATKKNENKKSKAIKKPAATEMPAATETPAPSVKDGAEAKPAAQEVMTTSAAAAAPAAAATDAAAPPKDDNPYREIVNRRLRTLRKRLAKITKYEEEVAAGRGASLNPDQRQAIDKKDEVVLMIAELDELVKQIGDKFMEDARSLKKAKKAAEAEAFKAQQEAATKATTLVAQRLSAVARLLVAATTLIPQLPQTLTAKTEKDRVLAAFEKLVSVGGLDDVDALVEEKATLLTSLLLPASESDEAANLDAITAIVDSLFSAAKAPATVPESVQHAAPAPVIAPIVQEQLNRISFMAQPAEPIAAAPATDPSLQIMQHDSAIIMARVHSEEFEYGKSSSAGMAKEMVFIGDAKQVPAAAAAPKPIAKPQPAAQAPVQQQQQQPLQASRTRDERSVRGGMRGGFRGGFRGGRGRGRDASSKPVAA